MPEEASSIGRSNRLQRGADTLFQHRQLAVFRGTPPRFAFRPSRFDRVQVRRVGGQIQSAAASGFHGLPHPGHLMRPQVVHDDHLAGPQVGAQEVLHLGPEHVTIGGRRHGHGHQDALQGDCAQDRQHLPTALRHAINDPLCTGCTAIAPG